MELILEVPFWCESCKKGGIKGVGSLFWLNWCSVRVRSIFLPSVFSRFRNCENVKVKEDAERLLETAINKLGLSARAYSLWIARCECLIIFH